MASAFTHIVVAGGLSMLGAAPRARLALVLVALSVMPDVDVLAFQIGIPYEHPLGHRGLTHAIPFAGVCAGLTPWLAGVKAAPGTRPWWIAAALGFAATASHGLLDALTNGGLGVGFLLPFSSERFFLPWRPLLVSPLSAGAFFSEAGARILASEIVWVWLPLAALFGLVSLARARSRRD